MFRRVLTRGKLGLLVPLVTVFLGATAYLWDPIPLQVVRNATFDQFQRWHPRIYREVPVRIVDIDDESLERLGQWPWPRTVIAELVSKLRNAGASVIAFDVIFSEPDRTSPDAILNLWHIPSSLRSELASLPDHDDVLAGTISGGRVILGFAFGQPREDALKPVIKARFVMSGEAPRLHTFSAAVPPLSNLGAAAAGSGAIAFVPDADGVVRRAPLVFRLGGELVPSLTAEILRVAQGVQNYTIRAPEGAGMTEIRIGNLVVPTTPEGEAWIHYTRSVPGRYVPAWKVLSDEVATGLDGHIVLVGATAQGLMDLRFNPMGEIMPGVEAHAQLVEQVLTGQSLARPAWATTVEVLVVVVGGLLVCAVALGTGALLSLSVVTVLLLMLWASAWQGFVAGGLLIDPSVPSLALIVTFVFSGIVRHRSSERRHRWVRQAFSRYVSPNLVSHLIAHPEALELGGRRQQCSFVFTDLAGFTTLVETMDPGDAVALLNDYLDRMIAIAFAHQGTLDRIVGDAVAIMFSAPVQQPDHHRRALSCALEMQRFASQYADELNARGIAFGHTRIGVHSGEVIVGNFGGKTIFDYRALGDPVNTAARLEGANRLLGTRICVSEATLAGCPELPRRSVGVLVLKGKMRPISVFEPLDPTLSGDADLDYERAFDQMRARSPEARHVFELLAARRPNDPLVAFHLERLRNGHNGDLIVMTEK